MRNTKSMGSFVGYFCYVCEDVSPRDPSVEEMVRDRLGRRSTRPLFTALRALKVAPIGPLTRPSGLSSPLSHGQSSPHARTHNDTHTHTRHTHTQKTTRLGKCDARATRVGASACGQVRPRRVRAHAHKTRAHAEALTRDADARRANDARRVPGARLLTSVLALGVCTRTQHNLPYSVAQRAHARTQHARTKHARERARAMRKANVRCHLTTHKG